MKAFIGYCLLIDLDLPAPAGTSGDKTSDHYTLCTHCFRNHRLLHRYITVVVMMILLVLIDFCVTYSRDVTFN